jgi:nitric oxide reductase subunit C
MTKRQTRLFFLACTFGFAAVFIALTIHSHTRFGELTNADQLTEQVVRGKVVWHEGNCVNCHTLFGEGAYYAPDLTKITDHRGAEYLTAFLKDPSRFYSEDRHRRVMPNPNLDDGEIADVIAFLTWVSKVDTAGWPPRPIIVAGATFPGTAVTDETAPPGAPRLEAAEARGEVLYRTSPPGCFACHSTTPGVKLAGPSLGGIATRAAQLVQTPQYRGKAKDAAGYIRESIVEPNAHIIEDPMFAANGQSFMPANLGRELSDEQLQDLVAYLLTLK